MTLQSHKAKPSQVIFVGSGPGDPELLTTRAQSVLTHAELVFTDPDVPEKVLKLIGTELHVVSNLFLLDSNTTKVTARTITNLKFGNNIYGNFVNKVPKLSPAIGESIYIAKTLITKVRQGCNVVRLVSGDPLESNAILVEISILIKSRISFEIIPGLPATNVVPTYAGLSLGSSHTVADIRSNVNWAALVSGPKPLILRATISHLPDAARALVTFGLPDNIPTVVISDGTTCQQKSIETNLSKLIDKNFLEKLTTGMFSTENLIVIIGKTNSNHNRLNWWESRALYGWMVLVPRTKDQSEEMSNRLLGYGALPVEVPTISVETPRSPARMERAIKGLVDGRFQWIVFTSTNAVRAVWEKFKEFGLDARAFSGVKIACIGQNTADRVREFGVIPELTPSGERSSLGLLDEFPIYDEIFDPVNRVLLPRADIATEILSEGLQKRGWEIEDVTAYRTVRASPPPVDTREMIKTGGFDAVCFTSSSTVRNLIGIAGKPHNRTIIACIGPKTSETAAEFGLRVDVKPKSAAVGMLVDALAEYAMQLKSTGNLTPLRKKNRRH